jgi:LacI family transcriptional regulator
MPQKLVRIGLVFGYGLAFYREILSGIKAFAAERPHWILTPIAPDLRSLQSPLVGQQDGFIGHIFTRSLGAALASLKRPVVNVSGVLPELPFPRVVVDHEAVGRLAAEHLLEQGLTSFGFVGYAPHEFSRGRERGFRRAVEAAGRTVAIFHDRGQRLSDPNGLWRWNPAMLAWLKSLPLPAGVFASHDTQGVQLSEYCRQLALRVPDDVALVGADDDDLLCNLARPSLSSVALPGERIGYEAATMLEARLSRKRRIEQRTLPPVRLVVRPSSDIQSIPDPEVAKAVRYIRDHADQPLRVRDVLRAAPASRRSLERRFRKWLSRGVSEEIRRRHLERARTLLSESDLPMSRVAELSGFTDSRQLSIVFRQATGQTPTAWRQQFRSR